MLVYNNEAVPEFVWRIENAKGIGPYCGWTDNLLADGFNMFATDQHPMPRDDFPAHENDLLWGTGTKKYFGFLTYESLCEWFDADTRAMLHWHGFNVVQRKAKRVWLSDSCRQLFFEPFEAPKPMVESLRLVEAKADDETEAKLASVTF